MINYFEKIKNNLKDRISEETFNKWIEIFNKNSQESLLPFFNQFLKDMDFMDISEKNENGNYKYKLLDHNIAGFDYMNVLKGNKKSIPRKEYDIIKKVDDIIKNLKEGTKALKENILYFDDLEIEYIENFDNEIKTEIKKIQNILKLLNKRRYAHGAEIDVRLNKYVLEEKINYFFEEAISKDLNFIKKKDILKDIVSNTDIEPSGIIGIQTKDTDKNTTTFEQLMDFIEKTNYKKIIISDTNPKNYFKLHSQLKEKGIKSVLSYEIKIDEQPVKIIIPDEASNAAVSLLTDYYKGINFDLQGIKDLLKDTNIRIIFPLSMKETVKEINHSNCLIGIDLYNIPKPKDIIDIKNKAVFIANNKYAGKNKIISEVIWEAIKDNKKINQQNLINEQNEDLEQLQNESLDKLNKEYLKKAYTLYPEIAKQTEYIKKHLSLSKAISPYITALDKYIKLKTKKLFFADTIDKKMIFIKKLTNIIKE